MSVDYKTWNKAVMIPISELCFTDWNCNEMSSEQQSNLVSDLENKDDPENPHFDEPIQVVPVENENGKWLVLGGEHRTKAMTALEQEEIPCIVRWDLAGKPRKDLMMWSVRRNNLRGKINAQKYAELEDELINNHGLTIEAARQTMIVDGDLAKVLRSQIKSKSDVVTDTGIYDDTNNTGNNDVYTEEQAVRDKGSLLQALKVAEQDVLLDSADTVDYGYLFFMQGSAGQMHLLVDESDQLHKLITKMVSTCKGETARVDDFLVTAIEKELKSWE